jgi:putative sigma-54 modulation protein
MNLEMTGRQVEITPALREFAEDKLRKLEKLLEDPLEVHVVLEIAKHRHVAEIQVKSRTASFSGMEETGDLYASISVPRK